ncbi:MAG: DUF4340 domain-containing protein [Gemmatimonadota bacterium]|uniref:DUF4340 domain-containing protein n=1 Tax=Candidatus Palauibacter scopulicola TaxID=3056741 RepID=UPI00238D4703|nr:DUF4340 domain-containing protein [Candidatus Palauibacter scopulicola]MDE2664109.1 DUF4340 domain-containing protein [Candidatus Palauibacter scopulicola]
MNAKQLKVIAIVLGVAVLLTLPRLFRGSGEEGTLDVGDGFSFAVTDSIAGVDIVLADGAGTVRLARTDAGWTVDGYVADEPKIRDLLDVIGQLSSSELVARNPSNHAGLGVAEGGRRIEVRTAGGEVRRFHLGDRDTRSGGYFVRLPADDVVYRLDGPAGGYLNRERDGWRPRLIASVDTAAVREVLMRRGDREAVLRRSDEGWLAGDAPADSALVQRLLSVLPSVSASGFPTAEEEAAADFTLPDGWVEVFSEGSADVTGRQLELSILLLEDEERGDWVARLADGAEAFRLSSLTVDRLLPEALVPSPDGEPGSG